MYTVELYESIAMIREAIAALMDNKASDQLALENYKQRDNVNTLVVETRQSSINRDFDQINIIQQLMENLPALIEARENYMRAKVTKAAAEQKCPVCFPSSEYYPYFSESEKERVRALSIAEQRTKDKI